MYSVKPLILTESQGPFLYSNKNEFLQLKCEVVLSVQSRQKNLQWSYILSYTVIYQLELHSKHK